jgi:hypothetical protein
MNKFFASLTADRPILKVKKAYKKKQLIDGQTRKSECPLELNQQSIPLNEAHFPPREPLSGDNSFSLAP